jgi:SWIM zinc finger
MNLTLEQIAELAPDPSAAAAGKTLSSAKHWPELGRSETALWGKCQGSTVYQVKVDLVQIAYNCTCPSRKFPCKHVLGVLMLAAQSPEHVKAGEPPAWVADWLEKRRVREEKVAAATDNKPPSTTDSKAKQRRSDERARKVQDGLERLDLWLKDSVRAGLVELAAKPASFWEDQAKRLVDAQAPGLAGRVARLASLPRSSPEALPRLLDELGRMKLLLHAYARIDQIEAPLASEIRQILGWNVTQEVLEREGQPVADKWVVIGQWDDDGDRFITRRSWLIGRRTGRVALMLQFSAARQPFDESIIAGIEQEATLLFYPGASAQRAKFVAREGAPSLVRDQLPGHETLGVFLTGVADALARQPWQSAFGAVLRGVTITRHRDSWWVCDKESKALPLLGQNHWKAMAITGGHPSDVAVEGDGHSLRLMGGLVAGRYWSF